MKDLKIEYRDGKLVELIIDGVTIDAATSISLSHQIHKQAPEFTLVMPVTPVRSLNTDDVHSKVSAIDIEKRFMGEGPTNHNDFPKAARVSGCGPEQKDVSHPQPPPKNR